MHEFSLRAYPDLNGNALGFYEASINGRRAIAHGGDTVYFHSELVLFPAEKVGPLHVGERRRTGGMGARMRLFRPGIRRPLLPARRARDAARRATAKDHARMIAGRYKTTRRADSTFVSLATLVGAVTVTAHPDDNTISIAVLGFPIRYREVRPFLWQEVGGHDKLQATVVDGNVASWSTNMLGFAFAFERQSGLAGAAAELPLIGLALGLILIGLLAWPAAAIARRVARPSPPAAAPKVVAIRAGECSRGSRSWR